jgi:hypothetical protein
MEFAKKLSCAAKVVFDRALQLVFDGLVPLNIER